MNRIAEVLKEKGIKQTWLAEQIGKGYNMVNSYVCNRRQPSIETLFVIAEKLNVKPHTLIKGSEVVNKNDFIPDDVWSKPMTGDVCPYCSMKIPNHRHGCTAE